MAVAARISCDESNREFGLRPLPSSTSNASKSVKDLPYYFEEYFTEGFDLVKKTLRRWKRCSNVEECDLRDLCGMVGYKRVSSSADEAAKRWLSKVIDHQSLKNQNLEALATHHMTVEPYTRIKLPFISSNIKPNVSVISNRADHDKRFIFFVEVISKSNLIDTIRKLYFDLLLQLLYIRTYYKEVCSVKGLVVPHFDKNLIVLCTMTWRSEDFRFVGDLTPLDKEDVEEKLREVIANQNQYIHGGGIIQSNSRIYFSDMLTPDDVKTYLRAVTKQQQDDVVTQDDTVLFFRSLYSIVFAITDKQKVYKISLTRDLARFVHSNDLPTTRVLLPDKMFGNCFQFPLLRGPLQIHQIQICFNSFAKSVHQAITELHETGYAHLDIRRPNICYNDHGEAILIDPDNLSTKLPGDIESVMYDAPEFTVATQYDWRQLAIMLTRVLEGSESNYHTWKPRFPHNTIGRALEQSFQFGVPLDLSALIQTGTQQTLAQVLFDHRE